MTKVIKVDPKQWGPSYTGQKKYKYLCPIGSKDPETKHKHETYHKGYFDHTDMNGPVNIYCMFHIAKRNGKKYTYLSYISLRPFGTIPDKSAPDYRPGSFPDYHKKPQAREIAAHLRVVLRQAYRVKQIQ